MGILDLLTGQQPQSGVLRFLGLPGSPTDNTSQAGSSSYSNPVISSPTFANSLTRLGFNMMADAAKPGATVLGSLGSAGATTIDQMDKIATSQQDNALKQAQAQYYLAKGMGGLNGMPMSEGFEGDAARAKIILGDANSTPQQKARAQAVLDTFGALTQTINPKTGDVQALQKHVIPGLNTSADWSVPTPASQPASPASAPIPATGDPTQSMLLPPPVLNKSGATVPATNSTAARVASAEAMAKGLSSKAAEQIGSGWEQNRSIAMQNANLDAMNQVLSTNPNMYLGPGADALNSVKIALSGTGLIPDDALKSVNSTATLQSLIKSNMIAKSSELSGAKSNYEDKLIAAAIGGAPNTPEGMKQVLGLYKQLNNLKADYNLRQEAYAQANNNSLTGYDAWYQKQPDRPRIDVSILGPKGSQFQAFEQAMRAKGVSEDKIQAFILKKLGNQ